MKVVRLLKRIPTVIFIIFALEFSSCHKEDVSKEVSKAKITVELDAHYISSQSTPPRLWYMISNMKGDILGTQEASDGVRLTFEYPDTLKVKKVYLTSFSVFSPPSAAKYCEASSNLVPSNASFIFKGAAVNSLGTSTTTIANQGYMIGASLSNGTTSTAMNTTGTTSTLTITQLKSPDSLFLYASMSGKPTLYKWLPSVVAGQSYQADVSGFATMENSASLSFPNHTLLWVAVQGRLNNNARNEIQFTLSTGNLTKTTIYFTNKGFKDFWTKIYFTNGNETFQIQKVGSIPTTIDKPSYNITANKKGPDNFSVGTTGSYDVVSLNFSATNLGWNITFPENSTLVGSLPQIPGEIKNLLPQIDRNSLILKAANIFEYQEVTGYDNYIDQMRSGSFTNGSFGSNMNFSYYGLSF